MNQYDATVTTRFLTPHERLFATNEQALPLVIEPNQANDKSTASLASLQAFLTQHSEKILQDIATFGAVLLRGFQVDSTKAFESAVLSIRGMTGMSDLFMSEPGRERVDGLQYVFHTNTRIKTGGTWHLGGFHNENYYSTDVPHYISFCCINPAKLGGETGLINMGRVYEKLDPGLKARLEKQALFVAKWPLGVIANRYQMQLAEVKAACTQYGLSVDEQFASMHKPNVLTHPVLGKKIIQANLCAEIPQINDMMLPYFSRNYKGVNWLLHKAAWRLFGYQRLRQLSLMLPELMRHPMRFMKNRKQIRARMRQYNANAAPRIKSVFTECDIKQLAKLMHECYAGFLWQKGDILLTDNLQIAHAGMPGKTNKSHPRHIRALLCNPLKLRFESDAAGLQQPEVAEGTLGEKLMRRV